MNNSIKTDERGRGKFKPVPEYTKEAVKSILLEKIEKEKLMTADNYHETSVSDLHYDEKKYNVISLFSGCGGLDLGFEAAGIDAVIGEEETNKALKSKDEFNSVRDKGIFHTVYANDIFTEATKTYKNNFNKSVYIDKIDIRKIKNFPNADVVLGGFPCPGFSEAGPRLIDDERNFLYLHFIRCLLQVKPKIFVAENVKGMLTLGKGEVFKQIVQDFTAAGYVIYHKLVNAAEYGVPQIRERVILVGIRNDINFEYKFPEETHGEALYLKPFVTLKEAIGDLENNSGEYFTGSYSTIFMSRNRKKSWNEPSFTIQASGRQAPIHPNGKPMKKIGENKFIFTDGEENNRRLSIKEIARIQTFPDWYEFYKGDGNKSDNAKLDLLYKQIGNAVPVLLARVIAQPIAKWVSKILTKDSHQ